MKKAGKILSFAENANRKLGALSFCFSCTGELSGAFIAHCFLRRTNLLCVAHIVHDIVIKEPSQSWEKGFPPLEEEKMGYLQTLDKAFYVLASPRITHA